MVDENTLGGMSQTSPDAPSPVEGVCRYTFLIKAIILALVYFDSPLIYFAKCS